MATAPEGQDFIRSILMCDWAFAKFRPRGFDVRLDPCAGRWPLRPRGPRRASRTGLALCAASIAPSRNRPGPRRGHRTRPGRRSRRPTGRRSRNRVRAPPLRRPAAAKMGAARTSSAAGLTTSSWRSPAEDCCPSRGRRSRSPRRRAMRRARRRLAAHLCPRCLHPGSGCRSLEGPPAGCRRPRARRHPNRRRSRPVPPRAQGERRPGQERFAGTSAKGVLHAAYPRGLSRGANEIAGMGAGKYPPVHVVTARRGTSSENTRIKTRRPPSVRRPAPRCARMGPPERRRPDAPRRPPRGRCSRSGLLARERPREDRARRASRPRPAETNGPDRSRPRPRSPHRPPGP
jgi:hypothetical protein